MNIGKEQVKEIKTLKLMIEDLRDSKTVLFWDSIYSRIIQKWSYAEFVKVEEEHDVEKLFKYENCGKKTLLLRVEA